VIALVFSYLLISTLQYYEGTQLQNLSPKTTINISNETTFPAPLTGVIEKGYFDSIGELYVYLYSPYANYWSTFYVWMSRDNSSWISVPFLNFTTDNYTQMADLGVVNLANPQLTVYQKYYVPPQTVETPFNVTKQDLQTALIGHLIIHEEATPADTLQWWGIFFAVSSFILAVTTAFLSGKGSDSNTQNVEKGQKKGKQKGRNL
jgi:hypothetical protein